MGNVYRTLVLKYDLLKLPSEVAEKISALLKVQEEFRRWANQWLKDRDAPKPEGNPLKYFAKKILHAGRALDWLYGVKTKPKRLRPPLVFDAQLRLNNERDVGRGVFVDIPKREVKIRRWSGKRGETIVLSLGGKAVDWILARVREGGRLVLAAAWVGASRRNRAARLYVALVFRREAAPMEVKRLLVIDLNALHNGVSWAVVEGERILKKGVLRPDVSKLIHLQRRIAELDSLCANKDKACEEAMAAKSRIWRILRRFEDDVAKELIWLARKRKAAIIVDVPYDVSIRRLKESDYSAERKVFLNFGRIRRRLKDLAEWYGVPYREERLYSSICPRCRGKMEEQPNRSVRCACGFEAHRDEVPMLWAMKKAPVFSTQIIKFGRISAFMERRPPPGWGPARRAPPAVWAGAGEPRPSALRCA